MEEPTVPRAVTGLNIPHQREVTGAVPTALRLETVHKDRAVIDPAMGNDHKDRQMEEAAVEDPTALRTVTGHNVQEEATEAVPTALRLETVHKDRAVMDPAMVIDHKDRQMEEAAVEDPTALRTVTGHNVQEEATEAVPTALRLETVHKDRAVMDPAMGIDHKDRQMEEAAVEDPTALRTVTGHNVQEEATEAVPTALRLETVHKDRAVMDSAMGIGRKDRRMEEAVVEDRTAPRTVTGHNAQEEATEAVPTALRLESVHKDPAVMDLAMGIDHKDRRMEEAVETDPTTPTMGGFEDMQTNI
ncbi:hypothetical protein Q1695_015885 [Nippostrongylus brasiliensis]|nr:hypothetical protein Q1695_015885 [Nippostrongylus brasiliensis]